MKKSSTEMELKLQFLLLIGCMIALVKAGPVTEDIDDYSGVLTEEQLAEMVAAEEQSILVSTPEKLELATSTKDPNLILSLNPETFECKSHNIRERFHSESNGAHEFFGYRLIANYANGTVNAEEEFCGLECKDYEAFLDKIDRLLNEGAVSVTIDHQGIAFSLSPAISGNGLKGNWRINEYNN